MDTQNTPVHIKLWHRDFWMLAFANMALTMSVYMLIPLLPMQLKVDGMTPSMIGCIMGVFSLGIFFLGGFNSYWIQRYRRNRVCRIALAIMTLMTIGIFLVSDMKLIPVEDIQRNLSVEKFYILYLLLRFMQGAFFALAQMVLCSTLIVDICESFQRTEANHSSSWFGRMGLSLGPVLGMFASKLFGEDGALFVSAGFSILAFILVLLVKVPFKAPDDTMKVFSTDKFLLISGWPLILNFAILTFAIGLILSLPFDFRFYALMMVGLFLVLIAERFAFANADLKSEVVCGAICLAISIILLNVRRESSVPYLIPVFFGFAAGAIGSRFQMFFIKLSNHCQRGTSMSTSILSWEFGLGLGLGVGYAFFHSNINMLLVLSLSLVVIALLMYNFFIHPWYMKHKNR